MIFNLDTNNYEKISLKITDEEFQNLPELIEEFCFASASFFADFAMKLDCNTEHANSLKEVFLTCTGRNINMILKSGILENNGNDN